MPEIDNSTGSAPTVPTNLIRPFSDSQNPCDCSIQYSNTTDTVGELMVRAMVKRGITQIFGPAERDHFHFSNALRGQEHNNNLNYYGIHHLGAATFACSAYGKLTGRPAACLVPAGQGAANFVAGLRDAKADRSPVLVLMEQSSSPMFQPETLECIAQWSEILHHEGDAAEVMDMACKSAILNHGVSQLTFPGLMLNCPRDTDATSAQLDSLLPSQKISPPRDALRAAIQLLRDSERPVMVIGQGARYCMESVIMLAEQLRVPVVTTFKGKGLISDHHSLGGGVMGKNGTPVADNLLQAADSILVFGANFDSRQCIIPDKPIIQVDHDLLALAKCQNVTVPVWGDIGVTAQALSEAFLGDMWTVDQTADVVMHWADWREIKKVEIEQHTQNNGGEDSAAAFFSNLSQVVDDDAIITIDAGELMDGFGRYFECSGQTVIMPAHPNTKGFALPAAMGAWAATQEGDERFEGRQVVAVCGLGEILEVGFCSGGLLVTEALSPF